MRLHGGNQVAERFVARRQNAVLVLLLKLSETTDLRVEAVDVVMEQELGMARGALWWLPSQGCRSPRLSLVYGLVKHSGRYLKL